jgi:hypothetical protein
MRDVGYHWSPTSRRAAIIVEGLRIGCRPAVNGVEDDHRNPWISLSDTPCEAWVLSAGALAVGGFPSEASVWDLWQADLTSLEVRRCGGSYPEIRVLQAIAPIQLMWIASRPFPSAAAHSDSRGGAAATETCCHSDEMRPHQRLPCLTRFTGHARAILTARRLHLTAR